MEPKKKPFPLNHNLLRKVFDYLPFVALEYPLPAVSRDFKAAIADGTYYLCRFFSRIRLDESYCFEAFVQLPSADRAKVVKQVLWNQPTELKVLPMVPLSTDGGAYSSNYFINHLFRSDYQMYSTRRDRGQNVHVLCVCSDALDVNALYNPSRFEKYEVKPNYHVLPYEKSLETAESKSKSFAILEKIALSRNYGYTCFMNSFVVFVSMDPIPLEAEPVKTFDGISTAEKAKGLGIPVVTEQKKPEGEFVEFDIGSLAKKGEKVYPLLFGQVNPLHSEVKDIKIRQKVAFKYAMLKFVDSEKTRGDTNIDCYRFAFEGRFVKFPSCRIKGIH